MLSVTLLVATLGLTGLLAYQAIDAARSHRNTAENTLRDYAGVAAWEFARRSTEIIVSSSHAALGAVHDFDRRAPTFRLPEPTALLPVIEARDVDVSAVFAIHLEGASNRVMTPGGETIEAAWLVDSVQSHTPNARDRTRNWRTFTRAVPHTGTTEIIAYHLIVDSRGRDRAVYGFIADAERFLAPILNSCSREDLLPKALARAQVTDSLLSLRVVGPLGDPLYTSPVAYDTSYMATESLDEVHGDLRVQAAVRPDAADTFIIGGLPGARLPLLIALMLLTLGVGLALMLQMRREQHLALLRDDFVSGVSHELRTPLAQIRMFGELLDQGNLRNIEEQRRSTRVINREARRLSNLVENILTFSRLRKSTPPLVLEETDIGQLIDETIEAFSPLAETKGITLSVEAPPHIMVHANRNALSQILLNLLDNAVKYGPPEQTVTINLQVDGNTALLAVEDKGPGIPAGAKETIWSAYHRLPRDANTTIVGSGIGLAVVAELAALQGGKAFVEEAPGGGARFVVSLPGATISTPTQSSSLISTVA